MAQKIYTNTKTKRMVIILGQANNYKPPYNPGPNCRGENFNIYNLAKKYLFLRQNCFFFLPPTLQPQI